MKINSQSQFKAFESQWIKLESKLEAIGSNKAPQRKLLPSSALLMMKRDHSMVPQHGVSMNPRVVWMEEENPSHRVISSDTGDINLHFVLFIEMILLPLTLSLPYT